MAASTGWADVWMDACGRMAHACMIHTSTHTHTHMLISIAKGMTPLGG